MDGIEAAVKDADLKVFPTVVGTMVSGTLGARGAAVKFYNGDVVGGSSDLAGLAGASFLTATKLAGRAPKWAGPATITATVAGGTIAFGLPVYGQWKGDKMDFWKFNRDVYEADKGLWHENYKINFQKNLWKENGCDEFYSD